MPMQRAADGDQPSRQLTKRERQIMSLTSDGVDPSGIATTLGISVNTVFAYRHQIRKASGPEALLGDVRRRGAI